MLTETRQAYSTSMLDHALDYLERGYSVFPVCRPAASGCLYHQSCKSPGKVPLVKWETYQAHRPTILDAESWWSRWPEANIGMATGQVSGVVVLDCDGGDARKEAMSRGGIEDCPTVWTGKPGGAHFWFGHPGEVVHNFARRLPGLDFRGDGGYVLLPPSHHVAGAQYRWAEGTDDLLPPALPGWLSDLLSGKSDGSFTESEPLDHALILNGLPEGQRDDGLWKYACSLRGRNVSQAEAEVLVRLAARQCSPPFDEAVAVEKVRRAYHGYEPNEPPAEMVIHKKPRPAPVVRLDIVRMSDVQPEPIEWLWRGRFARGKPTLLMGDPGLGKSLITHWAAATVSRGGAWPDGGQCERGSAILFTTEDGLSDTVAPRLLAAKADMQRVHAVRGVIENNEDHASRMFALTQHLEMLEELIAQTEASLVVMDPISAYLGPDVNSHKESDVRAVLGPLSLLAERSRIVLVMLMHLTKGSGVTALYRATGSIAFPAVARVVLGVARDPNDDEGERHLLLPIKMNIGRLPEGIGYRIETAENQSIFKTVEDQPPVLTWDLEPVAIDATSAMDRSGTPTELGAVAETKRALSEILAQGRVTATECKRQVREATGTSSETTLSRARKELGVRVRKDGYGGVWFWELDAKAIPSIHGHDSLEPLESLESSKTPKAIKDSKGSSEFFEKENDEQEEMPWR